MVHSETLNTCSVKGVVVVGVGVMVEEDERVLSNVSSGMLKVTVSTSLSWCSPCLRFGMMDVLQESKQIKLITRLISNLVHKLI